MQNSILHSSSIITNNSKLKIYIKFFQLLAKKSKSGFYKETKLHKVFSLIRVVNFTISASFTNFSSFILPLWEFVNLSICIYAKIA